MRKRQIKELRGLSVRLTTVLIKSPRRGGWIELGKLKGVKEDFWLVSSPRQIENPLAGRLMESFQLITQ